MLETIVLGFLLIVLLVLLIFCLIQLWNVILPSAKPITTEYKKVDIKVIDSYHRPGYVQMIHAGKILVPITHSADYGIIVDYDNSEYTVYGEEIYYKYKDYIGSTLKGTLRICTYKNGSIEYDITEIE